jgi:hypothetical protein
MPIHAAASDIVVPLRSTRQRRGALAQKVNHVIPAVGLFFAGQQAIREGHSGFGFYLGVFEIVSSAALMVLFIRELRSTLRPQPTHHEPSHPERHGVDWVDIAAGFVLTAEVLEHWHQTHHWQRPTILTAITTFAFGLFHGRIAARRAGRRALRVTADGLSISGRLFKARRLQATWRELMSIEVGPRWAVVSTRAGRTRKLDLADLEGGERIRSALLQARVRMESRSSPGDQA